MITSTQNPKIKWVRLLQTQGKTRREEGAFVVEGVRLAEEALAAGWEALLVLHEESLSLRGRQALEGFAAQNAPIEAVNEAVMRSASDTQSPQGLLAVLKLRRSEPPPGLDFAFIPDGVRDPGNLGTMLRTAAAAGTVCVFLPPGTTDPFAPKVVRAGMGAHFRLPLIQAAWEEIEAKLQSHALHPFLAAARAGVSYTAADFRQPLALVVGGEAEGAGSEAARLAEHVHIPMPGGIESLNAAIAAGILLFEVARQRTSHKGKS
jgi:TrmH family RNA methyltransferase